MTEDQENMAHLYAVGALGKPERASFEEDMRSDEELRSLAIELCEIATESALASLDLSIRPPSSLKTRVMSRIREVPIDILRAFDLHDNEGFVMTNPRGEIQWVNSDFSDMCGYKLDEIRGKKPGHFLQGPATDPTAVEKMRQAIATDRPVHVEMVNYHKNGSPYWVSISLSPVLDETRNTRCYVAIEREIRNRDVPAMLA